MAAGPGNTLVGPHAWAPDVAPTYRCLRETPEGEPCPAVGYRRLRSVRDAAIVEADPEDVAAWEYRRQRAAEDALARSEGREWAGREPDRHAQQLWNIINAKPGPMAAMLLISVQLMPA